MESESPNTIQGLDTFYNCNISEEILRLIDLGEHDRTAILSRVHKRKLLMQLQPYASTPAVVSEHLPEGIILPTSPPSAAAAATQKYPADKKQFLREVRVPTAPVASYPAVLSTPVALTVTTPKYSWTEADVNAAINHFKAHSPAALAATVSLPPQAGPLSTPVAASDDSIQLAAAPPLPPPALQATVATISQGLTDSRLSAISNPQHALTSHEPSTPLATEASQRPWSPKLFNQYGTPQRPSSAFKDDLPATICRSRTP